MNISFVEHVNEYKNNRIEILFVNFDYIDGNDLIAKILNENLGVEVGEKLDGIWFITIPLYYEGYEFKLLWHEDVGNCIYSESSEEKAIEKMRNLVEFAMNKLAEMINK